MFCLSCSVLFSVVVSVVVCGFIHLEYCLVASGFDVDRTRVHIVPEMPGNRDP